MEDFAELSDLTNLSDDDLQPNEEEDIKIALEIVELETGTVLEELKSNLNQITNENYINNYDCVENKMPLVKKKVSKKLFERQLSVETIERPKLENRCINEKAFMPFSQSTLCTIKAPPQHKTPQDSTRLNKNANDKLAGPKYQVQKLPFGNYSETFSEITSSICLTKDIKVLHKNCKNHKSKNSVSTCCSPIEHISRSTPITRLPKTPHIFAPINYDEVLKELHTKVAKAIQERKTFTVCGNFYSVRKALMNRGWIEKMRIYHNTSNRETFKNLLGNSVQELLPGIFDPQNGWLYKRMILTKLLGQHQVDFYWDSNCDCFQICSDKVKCTMINRFKKGLFDYTSKEWFCQLLKKAYWYHQPGLCCLHHPRSYNLTNNEDPKEFVMDFKFTAALSLLKWVVQTKNVSGNRKILSLNGQVPIDAFDFARKEVIKMIQKSKHEDIDFDVEEATDFEWDIFLEYYYKIVHIGNQFKVEPPYNGSSGANKMYNSAKTLLEEVALYHPELDMDGMMNIWILKPTNGCRGEGIYLCRTLQYILKIIKSNFSRTFIVQKYIEKPLLIYNTKFDIRQWFLISCGYPLTVWIYKDFYIRFSSQLYNLRRLHESIHLTNNSVQLRYKNCNRNQNLPACNMWDSQQFQKYLTSIGQSSAFKNIILPGIRECLIGAILMNQKYMEVRKNSFELYGADFMITEDFKPWLIEISNRPALFPSTPVTARLCPQVLEDVIKVVIDRPKNHIAPTGSFEILYKEKIEVYPKIENQASSLKVTPLKISNFDTPPDNEEERIGSSSYQTKTELAHLDIKQISTDMKLTLKRLLSLVCRDREKRDKLASEINSDEVKEIYTNKDIKDEDSNKSLKTETETLDCLVDNQIEKTSSTKSSTKISLIKTVVDKNYDSKENKEVETQIQTQNVGIFQEILNSIYNFNLKSR